MPVFPYNLPETTRTLPLRITDQLQNLYYLEEPLPSDDSLNPRSILKRINAEGLVDPDFEASFSDITTDSSWIGPHNIHLTPDGKLFIQGSFSHCNGEFTPVYVRLNSDGSTDRSFTPPVLSDPVITIDAGCVILEDGSMIVTTHSRPNYSLNLARLRGDSTLDDRTLWATAHGFPSFIANADPDNDGLTQEIELLYDLDPNKADRFHPLSFSRENGVIIPRVTPPTFPLSLPTFENSPNLREWNQLTLRPDFTLDPPSDRSFYRLKTNLE